MSPAVTRRQWISESDRAVWHCYTTDLEEAVCGHPNNGGGPPSDRPDPDDKVCGGCFALLWLDLGRAEANTNNAHLLMTKAGVPQAAGSPCVDPECSSHLLHRLHTLIAERDEAIATLQNERGFGDGPSPGWWFDSNADVWLFGKDAKGEWPSDGWLVEPAADGPGAWMWRCCGEGTSGTGGRYARDAMRAADVVRGAR